MFQIQRSIKLRKVSPRTEGVALYRYSPIGSVKKHKWNDQKTISNNGPVTSPTGERHHIHKRDYAEKERGPRYVATVK